jgi:hypothetical protein
MCGRSGEFRSACLRAGLTHARKMGDNRPATGTVPVSTDAGVHWDTSRSSHIGEFDMISTVRELAAEALFVSDLQPSECPGRETVEDAVTAMILKHGTDGCAAGVATEFGDHPEAAVRRMCWVRDKIDSALATPRRPHFAS